jgi:hypothetical protein
MPCDAMAARALPRDPTLRIWMAEEGDGPDEANSLSPAQLVERLFTPTAAPASRTVGIAVIAASYVLPLQRSSRIGLTTKLRRSPAPRETRLGAGC